MRKDVRGLTDVFVLHAGVDLSRNSEGASILLDHRTDHFNSFRSDV